MEIKPDYGRMITTIGILIMEPLITLQLNKLGMFNEPYMFVFYLVFIFIVNTYLILDAKVTWRTIIMDKDGCTICLFKFNKTYKWNELAIKRIENGYISRDRPMKGVFFSVKPVKKPVKVDPKIYCMFKNPFLCFFVYLLDEEEKDSTHYSMCVNTPMFFEKMKEWGIELSN